MPGLSASGSPPDFMSNLYTKPCWDLPTTFDVDGLPVEKAIATAKLNWTAVRQRIYTEDTGKTMLSIPGYSAIVRDGKKNRTSFGIVRGSYKPKQNDEVFGWIKPPFVPEKAGQTFDGKRVWMMARRNGNSATILVSNGHGGFAKHSIQFLKIQGLLGLPVVTAQAISRQSDGRNTGHSRSVDTEALQDESIVFCGGAMVPKNGTDPEKYLRKVYQRSATESWRDLFDLMRLAKEIGNNYQAVCYFEDYRQYPSDPESRRFEHVLFGAGAKLKQRAYQIALSETK